MAIVYGGPVPNRLRYVHPGENRYILPEVPLLFPYINKCQAPTRATVTSRPAFIEGRRSYRTLGGESRFKNRHISKIATV